MIKLVLMGASSLLSFGLMARVEDPPAKPSEVAGAVQGEKDLLVTLAPAEAADPGSSLRTAYVLLRQLKGERLEEKPRALADRAILLYRDGVKAFESGDVGAARKLGVASLELAQAVELTRVARVGSDDAELPAPPSISFSIRLDGKSDESKLVTIQPEVVALPPILNGEIVNISPANADDPKAAKAKLFTRLGVKAGEAKNLEGGEFVIELDDQGQKTLGRIVGEAEGKREFVIQADHDLIRRRVMREAKHGIDTINIVTTNQDDAGSSHQELQSAYELIKEARAKYKAPESKIYLDSARDLYNAARREAEVGRYARALELTRAAIALVRVPALLNEDGKDSRQEKKELRLEKRAEKLEKKEERKVRALIVTPDDGHAKAKEKAKGEEPKPHIELHFTPDNAKRSEPKGRIRIETRTRTIGPDGKPKDEVKVEERDVEDGEAAEADVEVKELHVKGDDAGPLVGVGLMLELEGEDILVRGLVPDGPAAKDGSIKAGDRLLGVLKDDGEMFKLQGKGLADVVKEVRGAPGTKAVLILAPHDGDEPKKVELRREVIKLPKEADGEDDHDADDDDKHAEKPQAFRFSIPGGGELEGVVNFEVHAGDGPKEVKSFRLGNSPARITVEPKIEFKPGVKGEESKPLPPPIEG